MQCGITNHYPILFNSNFINTLNTKKFTFRDYSQQNTETFLHNFPDLWRNNNLTITTTANSFDSFSQWISNTTNTYFPVKTKHIGEKNKKNPWITDGLINCIKKRHKFYKEMKSGLISKEFYSRYRNFVSFAIKASKKRYYNNAFIAATKDVKGTWQLINNLLDRQTKTPVLELKLNDESSTTSDPLIIANSFNNLFSSIAFNIHNSLPVPASNSLFDDFPSCLSSLFLCPTSDHEVCSVIHSFENKKCSKDDIPIKILKFIAPYISDFLASIFNLMIVEGHYPESLKIARVTPVHKSGSRSLCNNYRPISILKSINKIFERLIHSRLSEYINSKCIMYKHQYGFTTNKSTSDACIHVINTIQTAIRENKYALAVLRLQKGF